MALEQNEIKKVISVDLGNTTTSLKEYKKHIDELRGSLLQLDSTSEDYAKIAQEIASEQDKLNEVMKVGKTTTEAADGSYNQLVQTMAELKKQWRATADEAERNDLGGQILEINNKLKDLDASTGNYQRNVGDYSNAFEVAFDKCLDGIKSIDGPLGAIGGTTKQMIPVIKAINSTAISGLNGIKKAIASTGIGLLVVAVGTLVTYWDDISEAVNKAINSQDEYTKAVEESKKRVADLETQWKNINKEIEHQIRLLAAQGASSIEQSKERIRLFNVEKESYEERINQLKQLISAEEERKTAIIESNRAASYGATVSMGPDTRKQDELIAQYQKEIDDLTNKIEGDNGLNEKILDATNTLEEQTQQQLTSISNMLKSEEEKLTDTYNTNKAILEEAGQDTTALTEKYLKDLASLNEKYNKSTTTSQKTEAQKQKEELDKQVETILDTLHKNTTDQLTLLRERYEQELALLQQAGNDTVDYTQWYENEVARIRQEATDKAVDKEIEEYFNRRDREAEQLQFENELSEQKTTNKLAELDENERIAQREYEIAQQLLQDKIDFLSAELEEYEGTAEAKLALEQELDQYKQQYANNDKTRAKEVAEYKAEKEEEAAQNAKTAWQSASSSVASILGSLADLMEEGSEEQKALMIMETTINTLSGAIAAYQSMAGIPYVGPALGAAAAAAVGIAGAANIAKIRSTTKSSSDSSVSVATPDISAPSMTNVSPLLDEQTDINRMTTLTEQGNSSKETQNLRVYVVDQDIRDANHRAEVIENNTTF